jgi:hypothetical protein
MTTEQGDRKIQNIRKLVDSSERLGAIGSPSTTSELTLDIFGTAVGKKLVGELGVFRYGQEGTDNYALGQITEVMLRNIMLEQAIGRGIVRERERWDAVQGRQDTHTATMNLGAVFAMGSSSIEPSLLGTVPPTGTSIHLVGDELLTALLEPYKSEIFYLGRVYGSKPRLPMWFRHFGSGDGGAGEAYHIGIFGKTGSGKSVLAKMMLVAYARHKNMGLFVLDPQGEFAKGMRPVQMALGTGGATPPMGVILNPTILQAIGRPCQVFDITNLILDQWELFKETLIQLDFFDDLGVKWPGYQSSTADIIEDHLKDRKVVLKNLSGNGVLNDVLDFIAQSAPRVYGGKAGQDRVVQLTCQAKDNPNSSIGRMIRNKWRQVCSLFEERSAAKGIDAVVKDALHPTTMQTRQMVIIDLSKRPPEMASSVWDDQVKPLLINRFLQAIIHEAERAYQGDQSLNTLVVIDEAHRLAPRERLENERQARIKATLIDAVRTTRKYGLGWLFISLTLSSLDRDIVNQLRSTFFGFGLGSGVELQALRELVGGEREYLKLYQSFKDPHSAFTEEFKTFSFMVLGPVSPLAFSGAPLFFDAFTRSKEFLEANRILPQPVGKLG